nr:hypothetical protein [Tanacetum cinerariifolium]
QTTSQSNQSQKSFCPLRGSQDKGSTSEDCTQEKQTHISQPGDFGESDEEVDDEETRVEESFDPIPHTPESSKDEGDGEENQGLNVNEEEERVKEEEEDKLYRDVNINQGRGLQNPTSDAGMESIFATASTSVAPLPITAPIMTPSTVTTITTTSQAPILPTPISSKVLQNLPTFALVFRFNDRLNFSEVMQTNQFAGAVFSIPRIVQHFINQRMNEAVQGAIQLQSDRLCEEAQKENDEFLRTVDENIKKIIKEQDKEQVKAQVSKILPRIEQAVNEQ